LPTGLARLGHRHRLAGQPGRMDKMGEKEGRQRLWTCKSGTAENGPSSSRVGFVALARIVTNPRLSRSPLPPTWDRLITTGMTTPSCQLWSCSSPSESLEMRRTRSAGSLKLTQKAFVLWRWGNRPQGKNATEPISEFGSNLSLAFYDNAGSRFTDCKMCLTEAAAPLSTGAANSSGVKGALQNCAG